MAVRIIVNGLSISATFKASSSVVDCSAQVLPKGELNKQRNKKGAVFDLEIDHHLIVVDFACLFLLRLLLGKQGVDRQIQ